MSLHALGEHTLENDSFYHIHEQKLYALISIEGRIIIIPSVNQKYKKHKTKRMALRITLRATLNKNTHKLSIFLTYKGSLNNEL